MVEEVLFWCRVGEYIKFENVRSCFYKFVCFGVAEVYDGNIGGVVVVCIICI